jgi:hypothetical protein
MPWPLAYICTVCKKGRYKKQKLLLGEPSACYVCLYGVAKYIFLLLHSSFQGGLLHRAFPPFFICDIHDMQGPQGLNCIEAGLGRSRANFVSAKTKVEA